MVIRDRLSKRILIFTIFSFIVSYLLGQNLINHGSFESYNKDRQHECIWPEDIHGWELSRGLIYYSGQYKDTLRYDTIYGIEGFFDCGHVYDNSYGFQLPQHGNAYTGITYLYSKKRKKYNPDFYAQSKLKQRLKKNQKNYFYYYVSLAEVSWYGISALNVIFPEKPIKKAYPVKGMFVIKEDKIVLDDDNWTKLSYTFESTGQENYVALGNFLPYDEVKFKRENDHRGWGWGIDKEHVFYYLDNISLYPIYHTDIDITLHDTVVSNHKIEYYFPDTNAFSLFDSTYTTMDTLLEKAAQCPECCFVLSGIETDTAVYRRPEKNIIEYLTGEGIEEKRIVVIE